MFQANGTAERDAVLVMLERVPGTQPVTVGSDKGFDTRDFVKEDRNLRVTPHVVQGRIMRGQVAARWMAAPRDIQVQRKNPLLISFSAACHTTS